MKPYLESLLLVVAIVVGSLTGLFTSFDTPLVDFFIIAMLFFLFYNISWAGFFNGVKNRKYIAIALVSNFVAIPIIAFVLSTFVVGNSSAIFVGLIIYLVAPCTDWYLGFTKLANGDVEANSALLPFNLLAQILLLPVYLYVFTANRIGIPFEAFFDVLVYWVFLPFASAQILRVLVKKFKPAILEKSNSLAELLVLIAIILLVFSIFNSNVESLITNTAVLPKVFVVILTFFIATFFFARFISRKLAFPKKEEISLTMTTAARNAPLMLVISLIFFPQESLIHLVLVIGMLVEFPHLITITHLLKRQSQFSSTKMG
ncbi:MAG: bile acid:sodium symporter [Bacteroidota bacterium]